MDKVEQAAAVRIHKKALDEAANYANSHGHSIVEEVSYGRGYKSGYMLGSKDMFDKVMTYIKEHIDEHIWYSEIDRDCGIDDEFYKLLQQEMEK